MNGSRTSSIKAFISYAREDLASADRLATALANRGIHVLIDRTAIAPAEEFEKRLDALILEADAVVFLMSPSSLASRYCRWEVERAGELQKRIVPVVLRDFDDTGYRPPEGLRKRNWIFFYDLQRDEAGAPTSPTISTCPLGQVVAAITTDIEWQRAHTRHVARAELWHAGDRSETEFLLSGVEINSAQGWANRKPADESIPQLFFDHLAASLAKAERDREALDARERRISARSQQLVAMEAQRALDAGFHARAMRLCLAGEPTIEELTRGVKPEPVLRAVLAAAAQSAPCALSLPHPHMVTFAAFVDGDGGIITACADGSVRIWDARSGACLATWMHGAYVNNIAVAADGRMLAIPCRDGAVHVRKVGDGSPAQVLRHGDEASGASFSPDGRMLATASFDTFANVWDIASGEVIARLKHGEDVQSVAFSPDGSQLLTASSDRAARLWSTRTWSELRRLEHAGRVYRASFNSDGARVVTASEDSTAALWVSATGERLASMQHDYPINLAAISSVNERIATASFDRTAKLWAGDTGKEIARLEHDGEVRHIAFSPDGAFVVTCASDHAARIWSSDEGRELACFRHFEAVAFGAFRSDGHALVTASLDGTARVWRQGVTSEITRARSSTGIGTGAPASDAHSLDVRITLHDPGDNPNTVIVRNVADNAPRFALAHRFEVSGATISPDGGRIATIAKDNIVRLWSGDAGRQLVRLLHPEEVAGLRFSHDGSRLLTWTIAQGFAGRDVARLWDVETGTLLARLRNGDVRDARFGDDGGTITTHSDDGWMRTWDATFTVRLRDEELVRAVAQTRLAGEQSLTEDEVLILRPILGDEIERDVARRWWG